MKFTINIDQKKVEDIILTHLIQRFKSDSRYILQNAVNTAIQKELARTEIKEYIQSGVIAYLEKYPIKQILNSKISK